MTNQEFFADVQARVNTGVEWLNSQRPHWRSQIDADLFNIACLDNCILGQLNLWNHDDIKRREKSYSLGFIWDIRQFRLGEREYLQSCWLAALNADK